MEILIAIYPQLLRVINESLDFRSTTFYYLEK